MVWQCRGVYRVVHKWLNSMCPKKQTARDDGNLIFAMEEQICIMTIVLPVARVCACDLVTSEARQAPCRTHVQIYKTCQYSWFSMVCRYCTSDVTAHGWVAILWQFRCIATLWLQVRLLPWYTGGFSASEGLRQGVWRASDAVTSHSHIGAMGMTLGIVLHPLNSPVVDAQSDLVTQGCILSFSYLKMV